MQVPKYKSSHKLRSLQDDSIEQGVHVSFLALHF